MLNKCVIKRNGDKVCFDATKINTAIVNAMQYGSGIVDLDIAKQVTYDIEELFNSMESDITIEKIETQVYLLLIQYNHVFTAKAYEGYRAIQSFKRQSNTTDDSIMGLIEHTNEEVMRENSNKDAIMISTQRDLIAGEVSKDISRRKLIPPRIVQAHDDASLHIHDCDYFMQKSFNCCLINIKDMLDNGTVINKRLVESPKSFQVACTVMTQIIAQVASNQYGGQSVDIRHLGKYLKRSEDKYRKMLKLTISNPVELENTVKSLTKKELESGVQTIQYQINTLMTTNGFLLNKTNGRLA